MNNRERDSYYYILGVQPGTSTAEIKSAFRRLVKLYHADKDHSLDAEMKYREIQTAYKALLNLPAVKTSFGANYTQQTAQPRPQNQPKQPNQQNQRAGSWQENTSEHTAYRSAPRIPFSFDSLPSILKASFNELHGGTYVFALGVALTSCFMPGPAGRFLEIVPYVNLLLLFYPTSFIFLLLLRYYFVSSAWGEVDQFLAAGVYGAVLVFLITRFHSTEELFSANLGTPNVINIMHLLSAGILSSVAACLIIASPNAPDD